MGVQRFVPVIMRSKEIDVNFFFSSCHWASSCTAFLHQAAKANSGAGWLVWGGGGVTSGAGGVGGCTRAHKAYSLQCSEVTWINFLLLVAEQRSEAAEPHGRSALAVASYTKCWKVARTRCWSPLGTNTFQPVEKTRVERGIQHLADLTITITKPVLLQFRALMTIISGLSCLQKK